MYLCVKCNIAEINKFKCYLFNPLFNNFDNIKCKRAYLLRDINVPMAVQGTD